MGLLDEVTEGKNIGAQIHAIMGKNGVGKTTWAAGFPSPLIIDLENGSKHLNVKRIEAEKLPTVTAVRALLKELAATDHQYKTVVIDSVESLEGLIWDAVCTEGKVDSIEKYDGGYGKGYTRAREIMRDIMRDLQNLQGSYITSILVAHTQTKTITEPDSNQTYDRVIMRCNDKMAAIIRDLSDNVFYATYKVFTTEQKGKTKAFGDGQRVMFCQWRPGFDAKNRLELPLEIPLSYDAFAEACSQDQASEVEAILTDIQAMAEKVDLKLKETVMGQVEKFKGNRAKLSEIKNRLQKYVTA